MDRCRPMFRCLLLVATAFGRKYGRERQGLLSDSVPAANYNQSDGWRDHPGQLDPDDR
jgi:hypothetical protein